MNNTKWATGMAMFSLAVSGVVAADNTQAENPAPRIVDIAAATYPCSGTVFNDVDSNHWACGFIEEFLTLNITQGCQADDPGTAENEAAYCPGSTVTRDQMAVFFVRAMEETLFDVLDGAGNGLDADMLDGQHGAYYLDWNNLTNVPTDIANGDADTLGFMVCGDGEVPKFQDSTLSWVCGNDLVGTGGGGDITAVIAGTGLNGGATTGDATLSVAVPLALSGTNAGAIIQATNSEPTGSPVAVLGIASDTNGATSIGVKGVSNSSSGYGMWGEAPFVGAYAEATGTGSSTWGVYGKAAGYGVYGVGNEGWGVYGDGKYYGVYGQASYPSGPSYGVYGKAGSNIGYGVYSDGNLHVEGAVSWSPMTANLSVPAAAFHVADQGITVTYRFDNWGILKDRSGDNWAEYIAPVTLPDGASVTRLTFYWADGSNNDGDVALLRITLADGSSQTMATASSTGGSSSATGQTIAEGSSVDDTISYSTIDNANYQYYLDFRPMGNDGNGYSTWLKGVVITYTTTKPH
ncbi:hypothetical protein [Thiolapillus sp.]